MNLYYVNPSENPCSPLVSPLLSSSNYHTWPPGMKRPLIVENKFRFVNGTLPAPSDFDPTFDLWDRCNNLVLSWILNSVEPSIAGSIEYIDLASVSWKLLHDRFSHADRVRVFELQLEMFSLKQGNNSDDLNQITSL